MNDLVFRMYSILESAVLSIIPFSLFAFVSKASKYVVDGMRSMALAVTDLGLNVNGEHGKMNDMFRLHWSARQHSRHEPHILLMQ